MKDQLPKDWQQVLRDEFDKEYFSTLQQFVAQERAQSVVFPPQSDVFSAFHATSFEDVKVLLLGQDPYHGPGQAHGLSFSVKPGIKVPPSLRNMFTELKSDLGITPPNHGNLQSWAQQGMMMLNAVLTVRQAEPNSHKSRGWETFTDAVIRALNAREHRVVFVLWGGYARKKARLIDSRIHRIIASGHPSPLSIKHFRNSKPFSKINNALIESGKEPMRWAIPD